MWLLLVTALALEAPAPAAAPPPAASPALRFVISAGLRVRAAPSADAAVVDKIPIGSTVACLERSAPVDVGGVKGPFCRVRVGAKEGWIFEPLTEPLEGDRIAQEERLLLAKLRERVGDDRARWPDLYELHRWALGRGDGSADRGARMRARFLELLLVAASPEAFHADPRIYRDEAQGPRVRLEAIRALEREAAGTPTAESAAWFAVEVGKPFECEGYMPCVLGALGDLECGYLSRYPRGANAGAARAKVHDTLSWAADFVPESEMPVDDAREQLAEIERCLHALPNREGAQALTQAARLREALHKRESAVGAAARPAD